MKKFIVDKNSIDNFIRLAESQSRFTFSRKINQELLGAIIDVIDNGLGGYRKVLTAKVGGMIEYLIVISTKDPFSTIDLTVSNPTTTKIICEEHYNMPTQTLPPYTYNEIIQELSHVTTLFSSDQLETLVQTSVTKHNAMLTAAGGVNVVTDFQNEVLTCNIFNDEAIVKTLHFFIPKESIELGSNPTLYRYLNANFEQYEGTREKLKANPFACADSLRKLVDELSEWSDHINDGHATKLLQKLLYNSHYTLNDIEARVKGSVIPCVIFLKGGKQFICNLDKSVISEIIAESGQKYKNALRNSLLEPARTKTSLEKAEDKSHIKLAQKFGTQAVVRQPVTQRIDNDKKPSPLEVEQISQGKKLTDYNIQALFQTLKHIDTPEMAYDEIIKFIGNEVEFKGKITHKDMLVAYHFSHDKMATHGIDNGLKIDIKINRIINGEGVQTKKLFYFSVDAKREDIGLISGAFSYLKNMFN